MGVVIQLHADGPVSRCEYRLMRTAEQFRLQRDQLRTANIQLQIQTAAIVDAALDHMMFAWCIDLDTPPTDAEYKAKREDLRALLMRAALNASKER